MRLQKKALNAAKPMRGVAPCSDRSRAESEPGPIPANAPRRRETSSARDQVTPGETRLLPSRRLTRVRRLMEVRGWTCHDALAARASRPRTESSPRAAGSERAVSRRSAALLGGLVALLLVVVSAQIFRLGLELRRGTRSLSPLSGGRHLLRGVQFAMGLGLTALVAWGAQADYLFLASVFPHRMGWLAGALLALALAFIASALLPRAEGGVGGG